MHATGNLLSRITVLTATLFFGLMPFSSEAVSLVAPALKSQIDLLNELTERRRVNTFFHNEQTVLNGVQKGFVNVGTGNLTFLRRDLVTVGRLPVVFARVYDGTSNDASDFSPGWRISIAETINDNADGSLTYIDDSSSNTSFVQAGGVYSAHPAQPSDVKSLTATSDGFLLTLRNQWTKRFVTLGGVARLTNVTDNVGNEISLSYDADHRLALVTGQNGRAVFITRNSDGKVVQANDDQNRTISYRYNNQGQLDQFTDLGGSVWEYKYANSRLTQAIDPRGHKAAFVTYHNDGKVKRTAIRHVKLTYSYEGNTTTVKDDLGNTSEFVQNTQGATTRITNAEGFVSEIELNSRNEVTTLRHNGQPRGSFTYDFVGNPERMVRFGADGEVELTYIFDWEDRLLEIFGTDGTSQMLSYDAKGNLTKKTENGTTIQYGYSDKGDLISQTENGVTTSYEYNEDGLQTRLLNGNEASQFAYNSIGRLSSITFPDGNEHTYNYDSMGFRISTDRNDGSFDNFNYDATGNLTDLSGTGSQGQTYSEKYILNNDNQLTRIEYPSRGQLDVKYDGNGNPTLLDSGEQTISCKYDAHGRVISIDNSAAGFSDYQYAEGEAGLRKQLDDRTFGNETDFRRVSNTLGQISQLHYSRPQGTPWAILTWNREISVLDIPTKFGLAKPNAIQEAADQRRRLYNALATEPAMQRSFDKASNSYFLPAEYASANCVYGSTATPTLSVPSTVTVGISFDITADVYWVSPNCGPVLYFFWANGTYIGGGIGGLSKSISHVFNTPGTKDILVSVICTLVDSVVRSANADVEVEDTCTLAEVTARATSWLSARAVKPYERGTSFYCSNGLPVSRQTVQSGDDKCTMVLPDEPGDVGWAHLHPRFDFDANSTVTLNCGGRDVRLWIQADVDGENSVANNWSVADEQISKPYFPGYLKGPNNVIQICLGTNCAQ